MKKAKIPALCLAVFLIPFFATACGGNVNPAAYDLYNGAVADLEASGNFTINTYSETDTDTGDGAAVDKTVSNLEFEVCTAADGGIGMMEAETVTHNGMQHTLTMYYKDGFYYMDNDGDKLRYAATGGGSMPTVAETITTEERQNIPVFTKDAVRGSSIDESNDLKNLTFTVRGDALAGMFSEGADANVTGNPDTKYDDAEVTAVIEANGDLSQTAFACTMHSVLNSMAVNKTIVNAGIISNDDASIDYPGDLSSYRAV